MKKHVKHPTDGKRKRFSVSGLVVSLVLLVLLLIIIGILWSTGWVPALYLILGAVVSLLLCGVVLWLTRDPAHRVRRIIGFILAALLALLGVFGDVALWRAARTLRGVTDTTGERSAVAFYVLVDSEYETLNDLEGETLGILSQLDRSNTDETLQQTESEYGISFTTVEYTTLLDLADALRDGQVAGIVLNQAFLTLYEELPEYEGFPSEIRELLVQEVTHETPDVEQTDSSVITVLISGSDTRRERIDRRGRSDVNIIARVNRETHEILLVSTPRDYYVPLALDGSPYDKLTHAGIYGMDVLQGTLENLYATQIDYYVRINFTGFIEVIDALGGIEVYSDYDFSAGGYDFHQGVNSLNGEQALAFARERHAFAQGDRQRGEHQMRVIEAVLNKAMSPSILSGYMDIMASVEGCMDTNVPYDLIAEAVRQQLAENTAWHVETYSVNGTGTRAMTYSMPQQLYVMIPDETTVQEAKDKLAALA